MLYTIENASYKAVINDKGAELTALTRKADGYEIISAGDPAFWTGHSPILFPVVGKLYGDHFIHEGKSYFMPKHGFIGRETFTVAAKEDDALTLAFEGWEQHYENYPFKYRLSIRFALTEGGIRVTHTVENLDKTAPMYFSLGAHPAINAVEGRLEFPEKETVDAYQFCKEMVIGDEKTPFLKDETSYQILPTTFDHDAYILEGLKSPYVDVHSKATEHVVRVSFGGARYVGIWAKPKAPYVCIEPWLGLDDDLHQSGVLKEKKGIEALEPGASRDFTITIDCL